MCGLWSVVEPSQNKRRSARRQKTEGGENSTYVIARGWSSRYRRWTPLLMQSQSWPNKITREAQTNQLRATWLIPHLSCHDLIWFPRFLVCVVHPFSFPPIVAFATCMTNRAPLQLGKRLLPIKQFTFTYCPPTSHTCFILHPSIIISLLWSSIPPFLPRSCKFCKHRERYESLNVWERTELSLQRESSCLVLK